MDKNINEWIQMHLGFAQSDFTSLVFQAELKNPAVNKGQ